MTIIGSYAFSGCSSLTSITIPNSITTIGEFAFGNCDELTNVYCLAKKVPKTYYQDYTFSNYSNATLHVPASAIDLYKAEYPWRQFGTIVALNDEGGNEPQKCAKPIISYINGKLTFNCATEGATCQSTITDSDITSYNTNEVELGVTYNISVYATKSGFIDSDVATATLCWIDQQPRTEGIANGVAQVPALAVMIQSNGGVVTVQGIDDGTQVSIYDMSGAQAGTAFSSNGMAKVNTNLRPGSIAIVRIGNKAVRMVVK